MTENPALDPQTKSLAENFPQSATIEIEAKRPGSHRSQAFRLLRSASTPTSLESNSLKMQIIESNGYSTVINTAFKSVQYHRITLLES